jgi:hypothetical protein
MEVPRYCRDRHQTNNVASIWLLRGRPKHVCLHDVAAAPQRGFVPHAKAFFASNSGDSRTDPSIRRPVPDFKGSLKREEA